jgi:two-component system, LytTR family, sensor kinase
MTRRRIEWLAVVLIWLLIGVISGTQIWLSMITHGHSIVRLIVFSVGVWEFWALATIGIAWLVRRFPVVPFRASNIAVHAMTPLLVAAVHSLYWLGLLILIRPYDAMTAEPQVRSFAEILLARLPIQIAVYGLVLGGVLARDFYERFRDREQRALQLERSLAEARTRSLEWQMQPHFLFNTMNAISGLVRSKRNAEAVEMIAGLSDLLRYSLDHVGEQEISLEEELAVLRKYLDIQHSRFSDRLSYEFDIAGDVKQAAIPTLLLQPLAENALRHGISSIGGGRVTVSASRSDDRLRVEIFNNGRLDGSTTSGLGLKNTRERIQLMYGDKGSLELFSRNDGVVASLSIPWREIHTRHDTA